jgi:hypothetical protein
MLKWHGIRFVSQAATCRCWVEVGGCTGVRIYAAQGPEVQQQMGCCSSCSESGDTLDGEGSEQHFRR